MEINLEKIDLIKDRTGATYAEAKEALEEANGSVVDAIIYIEEKYNKEYDAVNGPSLKDSPIFDKMKKIVEKGNITKIVIKKSGRVIAGCPVTVGVAGAIIVPWVVILGVVAALGAQCEIIFVDEKSREIDLNGKVVGVYDKAASTVGKVVGMDKMDQVKEAGMKAYNMGKEAWEEFSREGGALEKIEKGASEGVDKLQKAVEKGYDKAVEAYEKANADGKLDELKEKAGKAAEKAIDAAKEAAKKIEK